MARAEKVFRKLKGNWTFVVIADHPSRPGPDLPAQETDAIKKVCKDLLAKLKTEKLVLAWRTKRTTRAAVRVVSREDAGCRITREIHDRAFRNEVRRALPACAGEVSGKRGKRV